MHTSTVFIRHGEYVDRGGVDTLLSGLTLLGREEMRELGRSIAGLHISNAYSVDNTRSLGSSALAIMPATEDQLLEEVTGKLLATGQLSVDPELQYTNTDYQEFMEALGNAYQEGRCLRFTVDESDEYSLRTKDNISSYSSMSSVAASRITSLSWSSIVCTREFFYPSLRSKLTLIKLGKRSLDHFVDYYCSEIELNPEASKLAQIVTNSGSSYRLSDIYGELEFNDDDLQKILHGQV